MEGTGSSPSETVEITTTLASGTYTGVAPVGKRGNCQALMLAEPDDPEGKFTITVRGSKGGISRSGMYGPSLMGLAHEHKKQLANNEDQTSSRGCSSPRGR